MISYPKSVQCTSACPFAQNTDREIFKGKHGNRIANMKLRIAQVLIFIAVTPRLYLQSQQIERMYITIKYKKQPYNCENNRKVNQCIQNIYDFNFNDTTK